MAEISIVLLFGLLITGLSLRANARFRQEDRLPMQWSFLGAVNWTAPRALALGFTPVLGVCVLTVSAAMTLLLEPRPGQEGLAILILMLMAIAFLAAHLFHLSMISKTLQRDGS